jgi:glycosyltransferase involved in cell wall biosynthesis
MLALTLHSVLWQEEVELEVIVVDDGSRDDVRAVVDAADDARVRLFRHEQPLGVSTARNRGVAESRGRWIAFLDDDDLWAPDKLLAQLRSAEEQGRGWAYVGAVNVTEDLRVLGGAPPSSPREIASRLPRANLIPGSCSSVVVRGDLLPEEPFDGSYRHFADWDLWIRLASVDQPSGVSRPLVGYRIHGTNASLDTTGMIAELDVIEQRHAGPVDRARFYRHVARVSQRANRRGDAVRFYLRAALDDAEYRRHGFRSDLVKIAHGVGGEARRRLFGESVHGAINRHAAVSTWAQEAIPWLEDLRFRWFGRTAGTA